MTGLNLWVSRDDDIVHPNAPAGGRGPGYFAGRGALGKDFSLDLDVAHPFSPVGRTLALKAKEKNELIAQNSSDAGAGPSDAGATDEVPTFVNTDSPFKVSGDNIEQFNRNVAAQAGGTEAGHMQPTINYQPELDSNDRVTKVNMTVKTDVARPEWSFGRVSDNDKKLIQKYVDLVKAHEERHRAIAIDYMTRLCKALRGQPKGRVESLYNKYEADMNKAQDELDSREGQIKILYDGPNGTAGDATDVVQVPYVPPKKP